jgi:hypothetical protein
MVVLRCIRFRKDFVLLLGQNELRLPSIYNGRALSASTIVKPSKAVGLQRWTFPQSPRKRTTPIDEHLLACQECQDRLAQVNQRVQAMRASRRRLG